METPRYGTRNLEYFTSILQRPDPGGPMWALNFIRHREQAQYADGRRTSLSGAQANQEYAPLGPLAAVGARPVFVGSVVHTLAGDGMRWDQIGVVRYPTRRALLDMGMREDFQQKHVHKEAGVAFTIVVASFPEDVAQPVPDRGPDDRILLRLLAAGAPDPFESLDSTPLARFSIEDVLIGDERRFAEARYDLVCGAVAKDLSERAALHDEASYAVLIAPFFDELVPSASS